MPRKLWRVRYWTGPTRVSDYVARARVHGFGDVFDGTEHVYFTLALAGDETDALAEVWRTLGKSFTRVEAL